MEDIVGLGQQRMEDIDGKEIRPQGNIEIRDKVTGQITAAAIRGTAQDHSLSLKDGLKRYWKAIAWSLFLSTAIIMDGFDLTINGAFIALHQFQKRYGVELPNGGYTITTKWQQIGGNTSLIGQLIGLAINGWASDRFGYKRVMCWSLASMIPLIFIPFFAFSIEMLVAGQALMGIPEGIFQTLTTTYASEIVPVLFRNYATAYVQFSWNMGGLIASGVVRGLLQVEGQWAYRIPFALQWVWPLPLLIGCALAPESPWWLVRQGRLGDARKVLNRIDTKHDDSDIESTLSVMIYTNALEKASSQGTSYWHCFRGVDLRRTEIACGVWMIQALCGSVLIGQAPFFLEQAGLPETQAFNLGLGMSGIGFLGFFISYVMMKYVGRRTLYLGGLAVLLLLLLIIGALGCINDQSGAWGVGALILAFSLVYNTTIGPVCYALVSEVSSTRLRAKTVVVARLAYNVVSCINGIIEPLFINSTSLNWGAKVAFFWSGITFLILMWTYFRCPEPKGLTYGELDVLFERRVSARKFQSTPVDLFGENEAIVAQQIEIDCSGERENRGERE